MSCLEKHAVLTVIKRPKQIDQIMNITVNRRLRKTYKAIGKLNKENINYFLVKFTYSEFGNFYQIIAVNGHPTIALNAVKKMKHRKFSIIQNPTARETIVWPNELGRNDVAELNIPGANKENKQ